MQQTPKGNIYCIRSQLHDKEAVGHLNHTSKKWVGESINKEDSFQKLQRKMKGIYFKLGKDACITFKAL